MKHWRRLSAGWASQIERVNRELPAIIEATRQVADSDSLPPDLDGLVRGVLKADPAQSWDHVIARIAAEKHGNN
jgi:hypothetical protein